MEPAWPVAPGSRAARLRSRLRFANLDPLLALLLAGWPYRMVGSRRRRLDAARQPRPRRHAHAGAAARAARHGRDRPLPFARPALAAPPAGRAGAAGALRAAGAGGGAAPAGQALA